MARIIGDHASREADRAPPASGHRRELLPEGRAAAALAGALALLTGLPAAPGWAAGRTERVNISTDGRQTDRGDEPGHGPQAISADGRFVAFGSLAGNLVPGDTNKRFDVFIRDRWTERTERVSLATGGGESEGSSLAPSPAISANGRFVAFDSDAANLVPGDTNRHVDVFVRDRRTGRTERVSVATGGRQGASTSAGQAISADGRFVAFSSYAGNLVPGDTNGVADIFVRDRRKGRTERVSVATDGTQGNFQSLDMAISADGRFVAFESAASNLVPGDTNEGGDVFVRDRWTKRTERVSLATGGRQADSGSSFPAISADGRFVAFVSGATNLVSGDTNQVIDAFVRDRRTGRTKRVSVGPGGAQGNGDCFSASVSAGGRFVAFVSLASNLVPGDTNQNFDAFVRDQRRGRTERVSVGRGGAQGNGGVGFARISARGRHVAFDSDASNLVPGDTNGTHDVFVRTRWQAPRPDRSSP